MVGKSRAKSGADKLARRMQILESALELWENSSYEALTMSQVADRLELAKGTLYLYFPSKEELFLAIYIQLLDEWFDQVELGLADLVHPNSSKVAQVLVDLFLARPNLRRLMPLTALQLEAASSETAAQEYEDWLGLKLERLGPTFESVLPGLPKGAGARSLIYFTALAAGLSPMADMAARRSSAPERTSHPLVHVDLENALTEAFSAVLQGQIKFGS